MRKISYTLVIAAVVMFITGLATSYPASAAVGRTPGSFAVSSSGAATYSIPIWAPPGPHGVQPHIALTYNSNLGPGYVGVGWRVSGLSSIYRCNATYVQDPAPAPIALTTSDGFCMDGKRLRLISGTYGAAGSTYQTETTNFATVTAYSSAGNGPGYFVAQDRTGVTYTYGGTVDSQVIAPGSSPATALSWQLNLVKDPAGNTMTIIYNTSNGTAVPSLISWTPGTYGSTTSYQYTMLFSYGARELTQNASAKYVAGSFVTNSQLLASITIRYIGNNTVVKDYVLGYQTSPTTGRDELISIKECADSAQQNCLSPTAITYQNGEAGVGAAGPTAPGFSVYDFNGDGRPDAVYSNGTDLFVALNTGNGFGTPINTGIPATSPVAYGNVLGTGSDGILAQSGSTLYYYAYSASTNSFSSVNTGASVASGSKFLLADITGDGLPDLVVTNSSALALAVTTLPNLCSNTPNPCSGGVPSFGSAYSFNLPITISNFWSAAYSTGSINSGQALRAFDFNGDGRQDLSIEVVGRHSSGGELLINTYWYELISQGANAPFQVVQLPFDSQSNPPAVFGNFNDDPCTDAALGSIVYYSACNGSVATTVTLSGSPNIIAAMDWDGDGRTDLIIGAPGGTASWLQSTGTGFSATQATSFTIPSGCLDAFSVVDMDGDGLDDLACTTVSGASYFLHNQAGHPPDLLSEISDGYGNYVKPTYVSLTQSVNGTYYEPYDAQYPYENYNGSVYLVNQAVFSDPSSASGGTYYQNYFYSGLWLNLQGRGLMPLGNVQTYDSRNGVWDTVIYQRAFPYTGLFGGENTTSNNNLGSGMLRSVSTTPAYTVSGTSYQQIYFPYLSNETIENYELGTSSTRLVRTTSTNYSYDGYGNAKNITRTVMDNDTGSPYYGQSWTTAIANMTDPDTSTGCLSLLTQTQVVYTASSGSTPVTRTKQFTPDLTNCRYTKIVTEPSSNLYKVTEDLGYDSFGNINSDTITGVGMAARTTMTNWSNSTYTTGQFPLSITDASGATTQFVYNYIFGVPSSMTDPNNETTGWQYGDGFGRKTLETRPDGTSTTWSYSLCSGCDPLPRLVATEQPRDTSGNVITTSVHYKDMLDRPLYEVATLLNGSPAFKAVQKYDSLGRVQTNYFPFLEGSPSVGQVTYGYDVLNRVTQVQRPISATNSSLQTTGYQYSGDTTTITDPIGNPRALVKDPNGWLRKTTDAYGYAVTLGYDVAGAKTSVTDSLGNALWSGSYAYGIQPFLLGSTDMDRGSLSVNTIDALGDIQAWTDAKGQHFYETYDALSRPLTRSEPDFFTQWTWGSTPAAHNVGTLQSVCTGTGSSPINCTAAPGLSESRTYDADARLYQRTITLPAGNGSYTYTSQYNATTGLPDTMTYPVSTNGCQVVVKYGYSYGLLTSLTDDSSSTQCGSTGTVFWTANAQNPAGQITQETLGNGIVVNRAFDAVTRWLGSIQAGVSGGAGVQNQSFLYDEMGNVTQRQDNNLGLTENAYYDNDYRLNSTTLNGTQNLSITYDNTMGNITARSDVAGNATWTYSPTQKHAVTQAGSSAYAYAYDLNGNMSSRQGQTIQWSSYNYPTTISAGNGSTAESISLGYGPDRARWQQIYTGNGTSETTDYVGGLMDVVISGAAIDYRHYIYAGSEPIAVYSRKSSGANTFSYFLSDHQSSVAKITNSSGAVVVSESFTPSGNRRNPATWSGSASTSDLTTAAGVSRQGYTFQTQLGLWMGLNHMNGRVQDAVIGRFLSGDPTIPDPTNSQSYNRYTYVNNNPLSGIDPSGFNTSDLFKDGDGSTNGDDLWSFASFGQEAQCEGSCPAYPGTVTYHVEWGSGSGGRSNVSSATSQTAVDDSSSQGDQSTSGVTGSPQGDPTSDVVVTASRPTGIDAQLWPITTAVLDGMLQQAGNWRRAILGNRGLASLAHVPGYGFANCLYSGTCGSGEWAVAIEGMLTPAGKEELADEALVGFMNEMKICSGTDCSEIAESLQGAAGGSGTIMRFEPALGQRLSLTEYGTTEGGFIYHEVFTDGGFVYDPRFSPSPVPLQGYLNYIGSLNPGVVVIPR